MLAQATGPLSEALGDVPDGRDNLVVRAIERLQQEAGVPSGVMIRLVKRIPSAAGLGGASSDVAAALMAVNRLWRLNWSRDRLASFSAEFGSDIPFFCFARPAICQGRGERVQPVSRFGRIHLVIIKPPIALSTADVYRQCEVPTAPADVAPLIESLAAARQDSLATGLCNRLQAAAGKMTSWIERLEGALDGTGCRAHQMTGSGSSYFGIFGSRRKAIRAASYLRSQGLGVVIPCATL